jgi:hypothetical protein
MANIKTTQEQWAKAKAYYESGLLLKEISQKTKIAIPNISKKAKAEGWAKANEKQILIIEESRVRAAKANLGQIELQIHNELVDERTNDIIYFNKAQKRLAAVGMSMIEQKLDKNGKPTDELSVMELAGVSKVVKDSREGVVGKAPDVAVQINNGFESVLKRVRRD